MRRLLRPVVGRQIDFPGAADRFAAFMMPPLQRWSVTLALGAGLALLAGAGAGCGSKPAQPLARTGAEIFQSCLLCHSTKEMQRGPVLDGLPAWYAEAQLEKFASGLRGRNPDNRSEALMGAGQAIVHDPEERRRVAEHIASLPVRKHLLTVRGDGERGRQLYQSCIACHGARAEGREDLKSPPLTPLEDWFQLEQLRKFKTGLRGGDERDATAALMRAAVQALGDQDFRDVTRFIAEELAAERR